VSYSITIF